LLCPTLHIKYAVLDIAAVTGTTITFSFCSQRENLLGIAAMGFLQATCPSCHPINSFKALKIDITSRHLWECISTPSVFTGP